MASELVEVGPGVPICICGGVGERNPRQAQTKNPLASLSRDAASRGQPLPGFRFGNPQNLMSGAAELVGGVGGLAGGRGSEGVAEPGE